MQAPKRKQFSFLLVLATILFSTSVFCQENSNFSYLVSCFNDPKTDSFDIDIQGIGTVKTININSNTIEAGLTYYYIPLDKRDKAASKLAELATNRHIETWRNNSRIIVKEKYKIGSANIIDLRLHMLIEGIYLQMIIVCDNDKIYELMCFKDTNEKNYFDNLIKRVKEKNCL